MVKSFTVVVNQDTDEHVVQALAAALRGNGGPARQLRDFADTLEKEQPVGGLTFQPQTGQILACRFGLGFEIPENVKTRPVLVISPHQHTWTGLCIVMPISSTPPNPVRPYHFRLPNEAVPGEKYDEAWLKGDMLVAVGARRLDRLKVGFRQYVAPTVAPDILKEARRCALHALGMHSLTVHW